MEFLTVKNWSRWETEVIPGEEDRWWFETMDPEFWYWFREAYWWFPPTVVLVYWTAVYFAKVHMKARRKPYENLTPFIVTYNVTMGIFSFLCIYRTLPFLMRVFAHPNWFHRSICQREAINTKYAFWLIAGGWSKIVYLTDTFFYVLRNKEVPFFHIYHHSVVLLVPTLTFAYGEPFLVWIGMVNMAQHLITYPFFAAKALKWRVPKIFSTIVLLAELLQMALCLFVGLYSLYALRNGNCIRHPFSIALFNFIYASMFILVMKMTFDYFTKPKVKKS